MRPIYAASPFVFALLLPGGAWCDHGGNFENRQEQSGNGNGEGYCKNHPSWCGDNGEGDSGGSQNSSGSGGDALSKVAQELPAIPNVIGVPADDVLGNVGKPIDPFAQIGAKLESTETSIHGTGQRPDLRLLSPGEALPSGSNQTSDGTTPQASASTPRDRSPRATESAAYARLLRTQAEPGASAASSKPQSEYAGIHSGYATGGVPQPAVGGIVARGIKSRDLPALRQGVKSSPKLALKLSDAILKRQPNSSAGRVIRAMAEEALGRHEDAVEDLRNAAMQDPRQKRRYELARAGKAFIGPDDPELDNLLDDVLSDHNSRVPTAWLFGLVGIAASFGLGVWTQRRRKDGRVALAPLHTGVSSMSGAQGQAASCGKYQMLRTVARDDLGETFEAMDPTLGRRVAIKRFFADGAATRARIAQARQMSALRHPALLGIYEILLDGPELSLVFEHIEGKTLRDVLHTQRRLTPQVALEILRPICQGVQYAHDHEVLLRGLEPLEILIASDGQIKLTAFGPFAGKHSPEYAAPESVNGPACLGSDVYSLGVCLYEMLTGAVPFPDVPGATMLKAGMQLARSRDVSLTPALEDVLTAALQPSPALRTKTAAEFLARLETAVAADRSRPAPAGY